MSFAARRALANFGRRELVRAPVRKREKSEEGRAVLEGHGSERRAAAQLNFHDLMRILWIEIVRLPQAK